MYKPYSDIITVIMNLNEIRSQFKILNKKINGKKLVYFDNAATTQIATPVLNSIENFETNYRSNVHRGLHTLSEQASDLYQHARENVQNYINALSSDEIVFTSGTTESLNMAVNSIALNLIGEDDVILLSKAEHHSNLLPWIRLAQIKKAKIQYIKIDKTGSLNIKDSNVEWAKVRIVSFAHISNIFGYINDINRIKKEIKKKIITTKKLSDTERKDKSNYPILIADVSQSIGHIQIDVQKMGIDILAFSGHKMYGPMGIGVLYVNKQLHNSIKAYNIGGGMVKEVVNNDFSNKQMPQLLEAGTPNVSGAIGMSQACSFIEDIGFDFIKNHEHTLTKKTLEILNDNNYITIYGDSNSGADNRSGVITISHSEIPAHDLSTILDSEGIAVRSGHHCVMPWHKENDTKATTRISFGIYNISEEIDKLQKAIEKAEQTFIFD